MASDLLEYIANAAQKASADLISAVEELPEDKRGMRVEGKGRSALDQAAECALINGETARLLGTRQWPPDYSFDEFERAKEQMSADWPALKSQMELSTAELAERIKALPPDQLNETISMPWHPMTVQEVASYPAWNMSYHLGQVSFIASLL